MSIFDIFKSGKNKDKEKTEPILQADSNKKHGIVQILTADNRYIKPDDIYIPDRPHKHKVTVEKISLTFSQAIEQGWHFKRKSRKRIRITRYTGTAVSVIIPSEIGGYTVNEIGRRAFYKSEIQSVQIPDTIKKTGVDCFRESRLQEIAIAEGITKIPDGFAFSCRYLKKVHLPTTLRKIGSCAFESCGSLKYINIPYLCGSIGNWAFARSGLEGFAIFNGRYKTFNGTAIQFTPLERNYKLILKNQPYEEADNLHNILLVGTKKGDIKLPGIAVCLGEMSVPDTNCRPKLLDFSECSKIDANRRVSVSNTIILPHCQIKMIVPYKTKGLYFPNQLDVTYPDGREYDGYISVESRDEEKTVLRLHNSYLMPFSLKHLEKALEIKTDGWLFFQKHAVDSKLLESISFDCLAGEDELFSPYCRNIHYVKWLDKHVYIPYVELVGEMLHRRILKAFYGTNKNGIVCIFQSKIIDGLFGDNKISQKNKIIIACDVIRSTESLFENRDIYIKYLHTHKRYAMIICGRLPQEYAVFLRNFYSNSI